MLQSEEKKAVTLSIPYAFFTGMIQSYAGALPLGIFLATYSNQLLPYIFVTIAVTTFTIGLIASALQKKISFLWMTRGTQILLMGASFIFWFLFTHTTYPWIAFAFVVFGSVTYSLCSLIQELIINRLFTLQQGKRIFGLIGGARTIGGILAGFSLPLLVYLIGVKQIILVTTACFGMEFLMILRIQGLFGLKLAKGDEILGEAKKISYKNAIQIRYVVLALLLCLCMKFTFYSIDMMFNIAVKNQFTDASRITSFFGIFFACSSIASFLFSSFVLGWIFKKFGVFASIAVYPLILLPLIGACLFFDLFSFALLFSIVALSRLCIEVLDVGVLDNASLLLFQPMSPPYRSWMQTQMRLIIYPFALAFIGIFLIFFGSKIGIGIVAPMILSTLFAIILLIPPTKKEYLSQLIRSVTKYLLIQPEFKRLDKESLNLLLTRLQVASTSAEIFFILNSIESVDQTVFIKEIQKFLNSPFMEVKTYVISKIIEYKISDAQILLKDLFNREQIPQILLALGAENKDFIEKQLENRSPEIQKYALVALIQNGSSHAIERLKAMIQSPHEQTRCDAASILNMISIPNQVDFLLPLLDDPSPTVKSMAVKTAINDPRLYPKIIATLDIPQCRESAQKTLLTFGKDLIPYIQDNFSIWPETIQLELIEILPLEFLKGQLSNPNKKVLHRVLSSLKKSKYRAITQKEKEEIREHLSFEKNHFTNLIQMVQKLEREETLILHDLLCREIELCQERQFAFLAFIYPEAPIEKAQEGLQTQDDALISNAQEILLQTLEPQYIKELFPQLIINPYQEESTPSNLTTVLPQALAYAPHCLIGQISSACLYVIGALHLKEMRSTIQAQQSEKDPLLVETKAWALQNI